MPATSKKTMPAYKAWQAAKILAPAMCSSSTGPMPPNNMAAFINASVETKSAGKG